MGIQRYLYDVDFISFGYILCSRISEWPKCRIFYLLLLKSILLHLSHSSSLSKSLWILILSAMPLLSFPDSCHPQIKSMCPLNFQPRHRHKCQTSQGCVRPGVHQSMSMIILPAMNFPHLMGDASEDKIRSVDKYFIMLLIWGIWFLCP